MCRNAPSSGALHDEAANAPYQIQFWLSGTSMAITSQIFEAYLKCPSKCWFRSLGEEGTGNVYADWVRTRSEAYRTAGIEQLMNGVTSAERAVAQTGSLNVKTAKCRFAANFPAQKENLESSIHVVERTPSESRGKPAQFSPVRFIFTNKLSKDDKLLLAYDAFVLSEMLRRGVSHGKIIHGDNHTMVKVRTSALEGTVQKLTAKIAALLASDLPPDLILNRHCAECEYQGRCRQKAIEKDDLSLLAGMTEKERKKLNSKGIFTITQLSHTFRPRRRPKRLRDKREKYHHSLKALAIREKKIHIVGSPELKIEGTPVYLDVEGLPDRDFYYLIGVRIRNGESVEQHSLWADRPEDEERIWKEFLALISLIEHPVLFHYGSFETDFLIRMCERYGEPHENTTLATIKNSANVLSGMYAKIYFPTFTNGLKDVANFLGFKWTDTDCSGILSIVWRHYWDETKDPSAKEKLILYNSQDCDALGLIIGAILQIGSHLNTGVNDNFEVVQADSDKYLKNGKWQIFSSPFSALEYINSAAHWNYQRDRVYARLNKTKPNTPNKHPQLEALHVGTTIKWKVTQVCPTCSRSFYRKGPEQSRVLNDILFGRSSLKLRLVKYVFQTYECRKCGTSFGVPERFQYRGRKYGWNLISYFFYQIIDLGIPQRTVVQSFNRLFDFELHRSTLYNLKTRTVEYYAVTKQKVLERIINGGLIHIDETRANIKGKSAFVWVLTSFTEVVYFLKESREGEFAHRLLADYKGVLVSDFYTAYDSFDCPQQKCLIHLIRDLNDEILNFPFDEQLKQIVVDFGELVKPMIQTVDRYGLKKHFLGEHSIYVDRFFRKLESAVYQSEAAIKCKDRFERNKDKLFTFLKYDGIPWNNNNAEHAIKAFAKLRDVLEGSSTTKGTEEYLILLSVCQTCKYRGLDFLDFLRSGEKDIDVFAATQRKRQRRINRSVNARRPQYTYGALRQKTA